MCGIAGFSGRFDPGLLSRMNKLIAHRGPDDSGEWFSSDAGIGLANRRLAIIDLSSDGHQPMANESGSIQLAFNGEIYNYRSLREELIASGHRFRSQTDTEVLIHLYEAHGLEMLSRLNGIFAFAIWDEAKNQLFVARDGVGVKPLYYSETSSGLIFASELKALLASDQVSREIDAISLHYHMTYLWAPSPSTMLKGVRKLPPGQALLIKQGQITRLWRHYDLPYGADTITGGEGEIAEGLRQHIEQAVKRQMVSDVPVGAMFSGGLDSSAVVAMMKRAEPGNRPKCYTIGFSDDVDMDGAPQDLTYARKVAEHLDVDLRPIIVGSDMIGQLDKMLYFLDEPQADPAPINSMIISRQARLDGTKVLLAGSGGDDLFSGYRRHLALKYEKAWGWLPAVLRQGISNTARKARGSSPTMRRLKRAFAYAGQPPEERLVSYFFWSTDAIRQAIYSDEIADQLSGIDAAEPLMASLRNVTKKEPDRLNQMLYLEGKHFLADHNLNYMDKAGMAEGVEIRVPLLDLDLIDYAVRIPSSMKLKGRESKYILKKAMEPILPREAIYRPKTGFGMPLRRWLHTELRDLTDDVLSEQSLNSRGLFNGKAVRLLMEQDRQGKVDAAYIIFAVLCMELWCRIFLDAPIEASAIKYGGLTPHG